jgi:phage gpG-like protein
MLDWVGLMKDAHTLVEVQSQALAETMIELIGEGFNAERDPYGRRWAPKKKPDGRKVLHGETSRLRNGWHVVSARRRGFHVAPSVEYAAYHQAPRFGRRPTRMMVPTPGLGLPRKWQADMTAVAIACARIHFKAGARARLNAAKARALAKRLGAL